MYTVHSIPMVTENNTGTASQCTKQIIKRIYLIFRRRKHLHQSQPGSRSSEVSGRKSSLTVRFSPVNWGISSASVADSRTRFFQSRKLGDNLRHFIMKAELQRFIKFIDNQRIDGFGIKVSFGQMIGDTSRRTDNNSRMISGNAFLLFGNGMSTVAATSLPRSLPCSGTRYLSAKPTHGKDQNQYLHTVVIRFQVSNRGNRYANVLPEPVGDNRITSFLPVPCSSAASCIGFRASIFRLLKGGLYDFIIL